MQPQGQVPSNYPGQPASYHIIPQELIRRCRTDAIIVIVFVCVPLLWCFAFIVSIIQSVHLSPLQRYEQRYETPFILAIIGIFIPILGLIASILVLVWTNEIKYASYPASPQQAPVQNNSI